MRIDIDNLEEELIKRVRDGRVKDIYLANHGVELDDASMGDILETARQIGSLTNIYEKEQNNND